MISTNDNGVSNVNLSILWPFDNSEYDHGINGLMGLSN